LWFQVLVGVLGNVITAIILTRRRMRSSTNVYLTALAASDLLYLLFLFSLSLAHYGLSGVTADAYWTYWRFGLWLCDATSEFIYIQYWHSTSARSLGA
jgi:Serpentine type 7TM GPCR chemoreceptor Srw